MNFFKQVDLDWMGKAKYFFALSLTLLVVGAASLISHGGPIYGIISRVRSFTSDLLARRLWTRFAAGW